VKAAIKHARAKVFEDFDAGEFKSHGYLGRLKFDRGKVITVPLAAADGAPMLDEHGKPMMVPYVEHEYSDSLMMFLLKGARPEKYRERTETKHTFEPIDWERVPHDVRDAFIDGKLKLEDVQRLLRTL
jgi:hypothetical protein